MLLIISYNQVNTQEILNIETKALMNGYFQTLPSIRGKALCMYKKNKSLIIITKVGNEDWWYGKTKDCEGWIYGKTLVINEEMREALEKDKLIIENEEKARREVRLREEKEKIEKEKIKKSNDKRIRDSITAFKQEMKLNKLIKLREKDSLAKLDLRNNCHYKRNEIDEFEKIKIIKTKYYFVSKDLLIALSKRGNNRIVYFGLDSDLGCASPYKNDQSFVKVKLENEDIITFYHFGDIDCAEFTLMGTLTGSEVQRLKNSPIKTIRLQGTKYYEDIIDFDYKEFFIEKLKCIE